MKKPVPLLSLLGLTRKVKIIDIGANPIDGAPPYAAMLAAGHAEVVGFEPQRQALDQLLRRKGPHETYLPHAIGDGKRHVLHICAAPGMTSLLEPNPAVLELFHGFSDWGKVIDTEPVDTVRLDDVAETAGADLIKIDVQGAELMVFQNATERLKAASVIHTEVEFLSMYRDQPLYGEVDLFLRSHGFVLHRFDPLVSRIVKPLSVPNNPFAGMSQVFWADAIYIRDFTRLELFTSAQLLNLSVILHDCYRSYDVALHLLLEHDRRGGPGHGARFRKAVTGR
jgi:FkbM family methyltransferase